MPKLNCRFASSRSLAPKVTNVLSYCNVKIASAVSVVPPDVPVICSATVPAINWVIGDDVDPSVFASPKYCAVTVFTPTGNVAARNDAIPAVTFVGPPSVCPLSNNCTGPVGVAFPFGFTVTVNVTGVPTPTCRFDEEIVVLVLAVLRCLPLLRTH